MNVKFTETNPAIRNLLAKVMQWNGITVPNVAWISQSVANQGLFDSIIEVKIETDLDPRDVLSNDVPKRTEDEDEFFTARSLDSIIKAGEKVKLGDVIVSKIIEDKDPSRELNPEEKLLKAIFGDSSVAYSDSSVIMPLRDEATVQKVEVTKKKVIVYLTIYRPVRIGDLIKDDDGTIFIIAQILPDASMSNNQVFISQSTKTLTQSGMVNFTKVEQLVEKKNSSSADTTRLLISQQLKNGVKVSGKLISFLFKNGLLHNATELFSLKSDGPFNFLSKEYEKVLSFDSKAPEYGIPQSVGILEHVTKALGVLVDINRKKPALSLQKLTDKEARKLSKGEVKNAETLHFGKKLRNQPVDDGLFCQKIFGPVRDYECACGKYKRVRYKGIVCDRCGVLVGHNSLRRERFGHIELAVPMINPLYKTDSAKLLSLMEDSEKNEEMHETIMAFAGSLVKNSSRTAFKKIGISNDKATMEVLLILPAGLRPMVVDGGQLVSDGLNDLYRRLILRNNRVKRLIEIKAPPVILWNEIKMLQRSINTLFYNDETSNIRYDNGGVLLPSLHKKLAMYVEHFNGKKVIFSGKSFAVPSLAKEANEILLPYDLAKVILEPYLIRELLKRPESESEEDYLLSEGPKTIKTAKRLISKNTDKVQQIMANLHAQGLVVLVHTSAQDKAFAFKVNIWNEEVAGIHPDALEALGVTPGDKGKVFVHTPLSKTAQDEAKKILFTKDLVLKTADFRTAFDIKYNTLCNLESGNVYAQFSETDALII